MKITVVGGGNIGTQFAVHCKEKKHDVTIYTSRPDEFQTEMHIINEKNEIIHRANGIKATNSSEVAFYGAELIFITLPAGCMKRIAEQIVQFANQETKICIVPGTGGGECAFKECIKKGCILFGLQRVPSVARLKEYGHIVCATGYREELFVAALPKSKGKECCKLIASLFEMRTTLIPNYLNLTLTPSNPILHTTRLYSLFKDYYPGKVYDSIPLFYEEWDDESSELLIKCDAEVQKMCKKLDYFDLSYVKSLKTHYESENAQQLTNKIRSITGFKGLKTPSIIDSNGYYLPDFHSRYFTADFSFGIVIIKQIANFINGEVPNIDKVIDWYDKFKVEKEEFNFADYGISNYNDLKKYYSI